MATVASTVTKVKIFIIHASFMDVRKQRIESLITTLSEENKRVAFSFEYINDYDPDTIKQEDIATKVNLAKANNGELYDSLIRNMHINQLSNSLKHALAMVKAYNETEAFDMFITLEDDVLYGDDVLTRLADVVKMVADVKDPPIDLLFLGLPSLVPVPPSDQPTFRKVSDFFRLFPCCDSYIFTKECVAKVLPKVYPIKYTENIQLSWIAEECKLNCIMTTPNVFLDGSKYGAYLSAVDPNSKLVFNPEFNKLAQIVSKKGEYTPEEEKTIDAELETIKFRNHPDVMHLAALYHMAKGDYKKAENILENVYNIITQNGCIVNGDTEFLRTYARLHKHTQDA
jgi:hypothetical protein